MITVMPCTIPPSIKGSNGKLTACQLTSVYFPGKGHGSLYPTAARSWAAMVLECKAQTGALLTVTSLNDAYRAIELQTSVFLARYTPTYLPVRNVLTSKRTYQGAVWYKRANVAPVASPGTSNHGYGLAADIAILSGSQTQSLASSTNVYNWMQDNAPQFGWTWETFPTAPGFEPWHLRHITGDTVTPRVIRVEEWVAAHTPA